MTPCHACIRSVILVKITPHLYLITLIFFLFKGIRTFWQNNCTFHTLDRPIIHSLIKLCVSMRSLIMCAIACICSAATLTAQVGFTANNQVPAYNGYFYYGTNGGVYDNSWDDLTIADAAAGNPSKGVKGMGSKTFRPPLPGIFVDQWGYNIRTNEFAQYYNLGVRDLTVFLQEPATAEMDPTFYDGCNVSSRLWKNLYSPIWDGGANGTPYNDTNYYAKYVYEIVSRYKQWTKFWEIINEPDFDGTGNAYLERGRPGNWWENVPSACGLPNLRAPFFHYVRLLRISYDIIKTLDPNAYIATGGLGYPAFLDLILRYTDNPVDGSVTPEYPLTGGAYFDVLSYHSYPQYQLGQWSNSGGPSGNGGFVYQRHSDKCAEKLVELKDQMDSVLLTRGYGTTYPAKIFICTESNIPRRQFNQFIGSNEAQLNYVMKALVESQKHDIRQLYIFHLGESDDYWTATDPFKLMGLYENMFNKGPRWAPYTYRQVYAPSGKGYKTTSDILLYSRYDAAQTAAMALPSNLGGAAFINSLGKYVYVLWAKTTTDLSESASGTYSFPASMNMFPQLDKREYDWTITNATTTISSSNIALTATPIFLSESTAILPIEDKPAVQPAAPESEFFVKVYPNPATVTASVAFTLKSNEKVTISIYNADGKLVATPVAGKAYTSGTHTVSLPVTQLVSGSYFCRFITEKSMQLKKLVISK